MKIKVKVQAVSWKNRSIKVLNEWANVADWINLLQIRVDKEHEMEVENNLNGKKVITKIYNVN